MVGIALVMFLCPGVPGLPEHLYDGGIPDGGLQGK